MILQQKLKWQLKVHRLFAIQFLGVVVSLHGLYILASTLLVQIAAHHTAHISDFTIDLPLLIGLSLLYLGVLLRRRKRTAWAVTLAAYATYLCLNVVQALAHTRTFESGLHELIRAFLLPLLVLGLLIAFHKEYIVKSDIQGFGFAACFSILILLAAFIYGVSGFVLMDESDFHKEIGWATGAHYTVDQFNLTTKEPLRPYTERAHLFTDSLSVISVGAVTYVVIALFQPIKVRLVNQDREREHLLRLLKEYGGHSEDFFKLWPHDKQFIFDKSGQSALAFHVSRGVALCLSDPVGKPANFPALIQDFRNLCFGNDWLPALIHVEGIHRELYEKHDFALQRLGQEAILSLAHFNEEVAGNKYFRQIRNKFAKNAYSYELLAPPHHAAVMQRLRAISGEWLSQGGRAERGFVMGYFTPEYAQQCQVMVARDAAGTIQGFISLVPASFDHEEATYDMLRHSNNSLGNINDYLLMSLIEYLSQQSYQRLNLGLCPLVGLDEAEVSEQNGLIDGFLGFAYANGDRFYSFQGLHRFKAKYEPVWRDRYVAYQGGVRGFARTMSALMRAMRV